MTGVAVRGRDRAGGTQLAESRPWFRLVSDPLLLGDPVVTLGDKVAAHGDAPHSPSPTMVEGEPWFRVGGSPVCRAEHLASCGHRTTGRYWFRLVPAGGQVRRYIRPASDLCNVEHIPWIMRAQGWYEGARLMERWMSGSASTNKDAVDPDTTTITMDFILGFEDALSAYQGLIDTSRWTVRENGVSAIDRLCGHLRDDGKLTNSREDFDYLKPSLKEMHKSMRQINNAVVKHAPFTQLVPDGLMASLGNFQLLLYVSGYVEPDGASGHWVTILRSRVFAQDNYDFEGDQPLGSWNAETVSASLLGDGCPITNSSFNDWRSATKMGADFEVYSDAIDTTYPDGTLRFHCS